MSGPKLKVKLSHETPTKSRGELHKQRKKELKDYLDAKKRIEEYEKSYGTDVPWKEKEKKGWNIFKRKRQRITWMV